MKRKIYLYVVVILGLLLSACGSSKKVAYLQNSQNITEEQYEMQSTKMYDAKIMPKDILTITVSTTDPEAAMPFNITVPYQREGQNENITSQTRLNSYLVDNNGEIDFPVLGMIRLSDLTIREAEKKIVDLLKPYIKEKPLVVVTFGNYKISVLGEVASPGTFTVSQEKINILEALAMAGDMTIYGIRNNVKVVREDAEGNKKIIQLNLNDSHLIFSDEYYLQQNDVVYVEPNSIKTQNSRIGTVTNLWISGISVAITIANFMIYFIRR